MAFRTQRGRPRKRREAATDGGTRELREKRRLHVTEEPLDALLRRSVISRAEHRAGIHFRWLYTLRSGAPLPSAIDWTGGCGLMATRQDDEAWRAEREQEYRAAAMALQAALLLRPVQNCCLYHEMPPDDAMLQRLRRGLRLLASFWGVME